MEGCLVSFKRGRFSTWIIGVNPSKCFLMKYLKFLIWVGLLFPAMEMAAKGTPVRVGMHVNYFDLDKSALGAGFSVQASRFHFDMSSNFARGEGRSQLRSNSSTRLLDYQRAGVVNAGYIIRFSRFNIIPKVGVGWTFDIWQTPEPKPTFYLYNERNYLNVGIILDYRLNDRYGIQFQAGKFERFGVGFNYYLGNL